MLNDSPATQDQDLMWWVIAAQHTHHISFWMYGIYLVYKRLDMDIWVYGVSVYEGLDI